jgi:hypothetical protein
MAPAAAERRETRTTNANLKKAKGFSRFATAASSGG